jgi:serpin B
MRQTADYLVAENDHAQVIEIPFSGGSLRWLMVVPRQPDGLPAVETGFNPELLRRFDDQRSMQRVLLAMPRLRAATETHLLPPLQALGVNRAFRAADADWSRLSSQPGLALDAIVHKTIFEVSEDGADSSAATSQAVRTAVAARDGEVKPLAVDRPFLVVVRDAVSHSVLFLGRIERP